MRFEDPFGSDPKLESQFASKILGTEVELVQDDVEQAEAQPVPVEYADYPDDRATSTSVRTFRAGLPGSSRR